MVGLLRLAVPTQLTLEPGEYVVNIACPDGSMAGFDPDDVGMAPPMVVTMAIPEDGNYQYQPPSSGFPIGSSGNGVGFPSNYFAYPVYPGSGASVGYTPQPLPPLRGSYMNPGFSGSGVGSGSPSGYMPGGWRPPNYGNYNIPRPYTTQPPGKLHEVSSSPLVSSNAAEWWTKGIPGRDPSPWESYQTSAGQQGEIDTTEDWIYGYDRDAINDPRTNKTLWESLTQELPFGVFSWDRTASVTTG